MTRFLSVLRRTFRLSPLRVVLQERCELPGPRSNYAINPTPELDHRSNRAVLPARVIAALGFSTGVRVKIGLLLVLLPTLAACVCGNTVSRENASPFWAPTCHEVNCMEDSIKDKSPLGTEMSIGRCIEKVSSMYRYLKTENGWKLIEVQSRGVESCPVK